MLTYKTPNKHTIYQLTKIIHNKDGYLELMRHTFCF